MTDPDESERLARLEDRIKALKASKEPRHHSEEHYSQAQVGWRMVTELVAGLMIDFGIGYGLDVLFGTLPILLVLFTMLGLVAGIKTMMRSARELQRQESARQGDGNDNAADAGGEKRTKDGD